MPTMIFHAPYPMEMAPASASRLRPLRMLQSFSELGYRVIDMSGTVQQRRTALQYLRRFLANGGHVDFMYSENSTQPNAFATPIRDGFAPLLDYRIMRTVARAGIPIGVFYRDCYWRAEEFTPSGWRDRVNAAFHRFDLWGYRHNKVRFFLPSTPMRDLIGLPASAPVTALWPGCDGSHPQIEPAQPLRLIYVGGMGAHYRLDEAVRALTAVPGAHLDLVTPRAQWLHEGAQDPTFTDAPITVHHACAAELAPLYRDASVGLLCVEPSPYRRIAAPVKLFEYLSYGRPIIVAAGTYAAQIVEELGIGWTVEYDAPAVAQLLRHLADNPQEVQARSERAFAIRDQHTWLARARRAAQVLTAAQCVAQPGRRSAIPTESRNI